MASFLSTRAKKKSTALAVLFFLEAPPLHRTALCRRRRQNPVRIRRSEIGKLACQAESERIFAKREIPGIYYNTSDEKDANRHFLAKDRERTFP